MSAAREAGPELVALEALGKRWAVELFNLGDDSWCCKIHTTQEYGPTPAIAINRALSAIGATADEGSA
jgi:hypothetical protein